MTIVSLQSDFSFGGQTAQPSTVDRLYVVLLLFRQAVGLGSPGADWETCRI